MACDFCNCLFLGCYDNCCDVPFIINNNPILATQTGTYTIQYIQEGSNAMVAAIDFTIGDEITFPYTWFNFTGEVKFQLILPDNSVYEFNTYDCFSFQKVVTTTPNTNSNITCNNVTVGEICTICDLLEALNIESQLLLEIRDINQTYLDTPLSELGKETTLQAILTAIGGFGGAYALESTLQLVLTQLGNLGLDSTLQSVLTQLTTLNSKDFATETTLQAVVTAINNLPAGGDATAANQVLEIAELQNINTNTLLNNAELQLLKTELQFLNAKDFSTETTLQSVLAALLLSGQELTLQAILTALGPLATEITLSQVLTELLIVNSQLTLINADTTNIVSYMPSLASIDANINLINSLLTSQLDIPLSSLDTQLTTLNLKDFATESTLQSVLAALPFQPTNSSIINIIPSTALNSGNETLIVSDPTRKKLVITNNTNRIIYVAYGPTVNTTTNYSFTVAPSTFENIELGCNFELSYSIIQNNATGTINLTSLF